MKRRGYLNDIVVALACGIVSSQLHAGTPEPRVPAGPTVDFVKADRNGDGVISKEEALFVADLSSAFELLDVDMNEQVTRPEFSRWSRAGKVESPPPDPATAPSGSAGAQHMPKE